jgi:hypothetical protein
MITIHFSPIETLPDAIIQPKGLVSKVFIERGVKTFHEASYHVKGLPYGYNCSSDNAMILFEDGFGTCVVKHGVIARLAEELELPVYRCEGFYPLTDKIVTGVDKILADNSLPYIPRIHCFLAYEKNYIDLTEGNCTGKNGIIGTYLKIFRVKPEQTQSQVDKTYRNYYAEICSTDLVFARVGVEGMLEILKQCVSLNTSLCQLGHDS